MGYSRKTSTNRIHSSSQQLTPREEEVASLLEDAATNQRIAEVLGIGIETVKQHIYHIIQKTGLDSRLEVAVSRLKQKHEQELATLRKGQKAA